MQRTELIPRQTHDCSADWRSRASQSQQAPTLEAGRGASWAGDKRTKALTDLLHLWPWELGDERVLDYNLEPQRVVPTQELLSRANDLRMNAIQGTVTPLPVSTQQGSIPANPAP